MAARSGYGVEYDGGFTAVVRARRRRGRTVFGSAHTGADAGKALSGLSASSRCTVTAGLSSGDAVLRPVTAPIGRRSKAARILPGLLERNLPFPLEQCVVLFTDMRRSGPASVTGLGMAALRERIEARRDELRAAGFEPTRLEHEGLALWRRSLAEIPPNSLDEPRVVLYATDARISLALGRGSNLERAYGTARNPGEPPAGARRVLQAWQAEKTDPVRGCWAGPAALKDRDRAALETTFSQTAKIQFETHAEPETFLARALAAVSVEFPGENGFLAGPLESPARRQVSETRLRRSGGFALVSGALLCAGALGARAWMTRVETEAAAELNRQARDITGAAVVPLGFETERVRSYVRKRTAAAAPLRVFFEPSLVKEIGRLLETARAQDLRIERMEAGKSTFEIEGRTDDWNRPDTLAEALRSLTYAPTVTRQEAGANGQIPFQIRGTRP